MKKRILTTMMSGLMAVSLLPMSAFATETDNAQQSDDSIIEEGAEYVEGQVIVLYKDGKVTTEASGSATPEVSDEFGSTMRSITSSSKVRKEIKKELNNTLSDQKKILKKSLGESYVVEDTIVFDDDNEKTDDLVTSVISSDEYTTEQLVEKLSKNSSVEIAEPNYIVKAESTTKATESISDEYKDTEYHLDDTNIKQLWNNYTESDGEEVVVAVLDTGVDYSHEDLKDVMWTNTLAPSALAGEHGFDFVSDDAYPMDDNGHGSHCAGIIAAEANDAGIAGVASKASEVKIMGVKVLDEAGSGYGSDILAGWYYIMQACENGINVKAVNCSLGGSYRSEVESQVIKELGATYGVVSCLAAGNDTQNIDYFASSPASVDSDCALTVAATNEEGNLASYSNYGEKNVDIAAPGTNIVSSVSYNSLLPYIYDDAQLEEVTQIYGEVTDNATVDTVNSTVTLDRVSDNISAFGTGVLKTTDNTAIMTLSKTTAQGTLSGADSNLEWTISNPTKGGKYLLVFPFDHSGLTGDEAANMLYRVITNGEDEVGLECGDFIFKETGELSYLEDEDLEIRDITFSYSAINDIWMNFNIGTWDSMYRLYTQNEVEAAGDGYSAGLGILVTANGTEDITVLLEDVAVTKQLYDETNDTSLEDEFGKYDLYSGTSMATPVVTGSVAMLAALNPSASAQELCAMVRGNVNTNNEIKVSTAGVIDFSDYTDTTKQQTVITKATVDGSKKTVTLSGENFGDTAGTLAYYDMNAEDYDDSTDENVTVDASKISWSDSEIVISDASLIGKNVQFTITTSASKTAKYADYLVDGMTEFTDEGTIPLLTMTDDWGDEVESAPGMLNGSDVLRFYDANGIIYQYNSYNNETAYGDDYLDDYSEDDTAGGGYYMEADPAELLSSYDCASKWNLTDKQSQKLAIKDVLGVAYDQNIIYEILKISTSGTEHYLLAGYDTDTAEWNVYYDSYGKKTADIPFAQLSSTSMTVYNGYLYMLGGLSSVDDGLGDNSQALDTIYAGQISKASSWTTSNMMVATLPQTTYGGKVQAYDGKIYYALGQENALISQDVYCYDISKKTCSTYVTLPDVIRDPVIKTHAMNGAYADYLQGTLGVYGNGLVISGISFDGYGDMLYINTSNKTVSSAYATIHSGVIYDSVVGMTIGDKVYVGYADTGEDGGSEAIRLRSFSLSTSAFSNIEINYAGLGGGSVSGDNLYVKGEKISGTIKADSDSFIQKVVIDGKTVKTGTAKTKVKSYSYSFTASKTKHIIKVTFGKYVSKVKFTKKKTKIKAGKSFTFKATTNGTNKNVKWKVSNKKYAKITAKGKFTAKKKGKGKTVKVTAISKENSKYKKTIKVKIK
ncbi:S8 family serine peptidase [Eubacterium oxidoreducens]|uniref:Serine protease, subtilisin family n=1 Tax=Eubacterium oxidoreducens TaxID=1732 RepID=A0A1G6AWB9_EUBOX|nr:S8 family serine peptidase [Eubacterium oxidoreducens]SDB12706.1 Serine protease, subtilisin family [Eubacterium oxidoreducens]